MRTMANIWYVIKKSYCSGSVTSSPEISSRATKPQFLRSESAESSGRCVVSRSSSGFKPAFSSRGLVGSHVHGGESDDGLNISSCRRSYRPDRNSRGYLASVCKICGENFRKPDDVGAHVLSNHAVTELIEGNSSRKIVEMICQTSGSKHCLRRVLKIHNTQKAVNDFEEYREMVKDKANKLPNNHPRCLADGNELLRFYSTTVSCSLGINGDSSLCEAEECGACRVLRHGFCVETGCVGIFTTTTGETALESIKVDQGDYFVRKALFLCRVIAGRSHPSIEDFHQTEDQLVFDSVGGKTGGIEQLYLLNPRALLPCFVVVY